MLDESGMRRILKSFFGLLGRIAQSDVLVVAALTGHSPAGGHGAGIVPPTIVSRPGVISVSASMKSRSAWSFRPPFTKRWVRLVGPYRAERHLVAGQMIPATQALSIGLVDEIVSCRPGG